MFIVIGHHLIPLTASTQVPAGTIIDALHGSLRLESASGQKHKLFVGVLAERCSGSPRSPVDRTRR